MSTKRLTIESVAAGLRKAHGNMAVVASEHGVTRQAVWKFIDRRPKLLAVKAETKETMKDHAESALQRALIAGEAWAVCFFLKTQAKDRGYIERQEFRNVTDEQLDHEIDGELARVSGAGQTPNARPAAPEEDGDPDDTDI